MGSSLPPGTGAIASSVVRDGNHPLTHYGGAPTRGGVEYTTSPVQTLGSRDEGPDLRRVQPFCTRHVERYQVLEIHHICMLDEKNAIGLCEFKTQTISLPGVGTEKQPYFQ